MESKLFIESSSTYTEDGRFIKSVKDSLGNVVTYDIDSTTGLTNAIIDPNGSVSNYVHDDKHRVTSITKGEQEVDYEYDTNDNLSKITHGTKNYTFEYDEYNNSKKVTINNTNLVENTYESNNGNLTKVKYGNNDEINYTYDEYGRVKTVVKEDNTYKNYYDNLGRITRVKSNNEVYNYEYDFAKRLSKFKINDYETLLNYDKENNITTKIEKIGEDSYTYNYSYNNESALTNLNVLDTNFNYEYDKLGRLIESSINNSYKTKYNYITNGNKTTTIVNKVDDNGTIYSYKYDKLGNITEVKKGNTITNRYYYDEHSQLIKDEDLVNNKTTNYSYDNYGNILSRKTYEYGTDTLIDEDTYEYGNSNWQDQLTKFNNEVITYDAIGNPLTIGTKTLSWKNGRELSSYSDGTNNITYKYNIDGIRTEKNVNGITTKYYLEGSKIVFEDRNGTMIYYIYSGDELLGFKYNDNIYYYHKNIFGDIIGILDSSYSEIVTYEYDSWGHITNIVDNSNTNLGTINPFRYRSYYYDEETNLYYLNSRYYNANIRRFINADVMICSNNDIITGNSFVYVSNNPINFSDKNGKAWVRPTKWLARQAWKVAIKAMKAIGCPIAADSLKHSLNDKPKDKTYEKDSKVSAKISKDTDYKNKMKEILKTADENGNINYNAKTSGYSGLEFNQDPDLFATFHWANIKVEGNVNDKKLTVQISDYYDFKFDLNYGGGMFKTLAVIANNLAYLDQCGGTVNGYYIYVNLEYKIEN